MKTAILKILGWIYLTQCRREVREGRTYSSVTYFGERISRAHHRLEIYGFRGFFR